MTVNSNQDELGSPQKIKGKGNVGARGFGEGAIDLPGAK